jgi:hypothetical protein
VTKDAGMNRFVWDVRHQNGVGMAPGEYRVRLTVGATTQTQPLRVLIDPRIAARGVTEADLQEQFAHNMRMHDLVDEVDALATRVRDAQKRLRSAGDAETLKRVDALASTLLSEPVRYGKPGLQAQVTYLAGMTRGADQKIGRDAIERYAVLKKAVDAARADVDRVLGGSGNM